MVELVIKIPESYYKIITNKVKTARGDGVYLGWTAITNGTPLPKGHGRLIDANYFREDSSIFKIIPFAQGMNLQCVVDHAPTIIEADKGE